MSRTACPKCERTGLTEADFYAKESSCKECIKAARREDRARRGAQLNARRREIYAADADRFREARRQWVERNPETVRESQRRWYTANAADWRARRDPRRVRDIHLRSRYGISLDDYEEMYARQAGACPICLERYEVLAVDHDHLTGAVRGLLCNLCNVALGALLDNQDRLLRAIAYLDNAEVEQEADDAASA